LFFHGRQTNFVRSQSIAEISRVELPVKRNFRIYYRGGKPTVCRHFLPLIPFQNALQVSVSIYIFTGTSLNKKFIKIISSFQEELFYLSVFFFCKSVIFMVFSTNITKNKGHEITCSRHKSCLVKILNVTTVPKNKFLV
jgi:hypothetical protein